MARKRYRKNKDGDWVGGVVILLGMIIFTNMEAGSSIVGLASNLLASVIISGVLVVVGSLAFKSIKSHGFPSNNGSRASLTPPCKSKSMHKPPVKYTSDPVKQYRERFEDQVVSVKEAKPAAWSLPLISTLEWRRFEQLCMELFKLKGYGVNDTGAGADGGTDFYLYKPDVYDRPVAVVQCKSWAKPVGVKTVRELFGVMAAEKIPNAIVMVPGTFTKEAKSFTDSKRLKLIDGERLFGMIQKLSEPAQKGLLQRMTEGDYKTPSCPSCDVKLVARKGKAERSDFWGCGNFPKCRYTMKRAD